MSSVERRHPSAEAETPEVPALQAFIAGAWVDGESGERLESVSPATGRPIGTVPAGTRGDVRRAIDAAQRAWPAWAQRSAFDRAAVLRRVAELVEERREELVNVLTLDQGKPLMAEAHAEVDGLITCWMLAAEDCVRLHGSVAPSASAAKRIFTYRAPRGVIGVVTPWNWPYTMPAELIAPALGVGNAVVWAPAPTTSICSVRLAECIVDAGVPAGLFNMVTGQGDVVGDEIASNPGTQAVGFIGSVATGGIVASRAAGKPLLLEMGGNGPMVVLDDADVAAAAEATISGAFLCAGQSCTAAGRLLVHEAAHDELVERVLALVADRVRLGDPFDAATTLGPMNNEGAASKVDRHVDDALAHGAGLLAGGARAAGFPSDLYWPATVLDQVGEEMDVAREETFGPVLPITTIRSDAEALEVIERSPYGLLAAVWSRDIGRALRFAERAQVGWVNINESTNYWERHVPFGGRAGSSSGIGRVGGEEAMLAFSEPKTIVLTLGDD